MDHDTPHYAGRSTLAERISARIGSLTIPVLKQIIRRQAREAMRMVR